MINADRERSLKSLNMKWLVMLASFDVVVILLFVAPEFIKDTAWNTVAVMRGPATSLLPVIVLLLTGLPSHEFKARLVYWRWTNPYPGSQAFTKLAPADARIDMATLAKNVGALPTEPAEQNSKWYRLYRMVIDDRTVVEAHKLYLMYRDMAALSFPLVMVAPVGMYFFGASPRAMWTTAVVFAVQYVACCLGGRNSGQRFVCNVLAIHSTKKVTSNRPQKSTKTTD